MNFASKKIRQEYGKYSLDEADVHHDAIMQLRCWLGEAIKAQIVMPDAMVISTVTRENKADARMVLLKGIGEEGFYFYTNYESPLARQLDLHPDAALTFFWSDMERQVRVRGRCEKVAEEVSRAYFATRPRGAQLAAWSSRQSEVIESRQALEKRLDDESVRFANEKEVPCPPYWGGYFLLALEIEFWQGRENRLHDRLLYQRRFGKEWSLERLMP